jgi:hypothetical protein
MSTDSYSEIIEMQKQALRRVQDMNRQARQAVMAETDENTKPAELPVRTAPREPKHTSLPVNIKRREEPAESVKISEPTPDTDRAVILSILMLLRSEGADELLLLALLYILA